MTEYPGNINEDAEFVPARATPMVERVAAAIRGANENLTGLTFTELTREMARAAIMAMKKPTEAQLQAARKEVNTSGGFSPHYVWSAMIDAALKE